MSADAMIRLLILLVVVDIVVNVAILVLRYLTWRCVHDVSDTVTEVRHGNVGNVRTAACDGCVPGLNGERLAVHRADQLPCDHVTRIEGRGD